MAMELTEQNFEEEVLESELPVLVDFYAEWCGPCKMMAPVIEKVAAEYSAKIKIGKLDVDSGRALAIKYQIMSVPTMILFERGEIRETIIGAVPEKELVQKLSEVLGW